ncbi:MAG: glycosyltransferase family 2 protein [Lachnospiraceae bacterium]
MKYCFDTCAYTRGQIAISGWAAPETVGAAPVITVLDRSGREVSSVRLEHSRREDAALAVYGQPSGADLGFVLKIPYSGQIKMTVRISADGDAGDSIGIPVSPSVLYWKYKREHSGLRLFRRWLSAGDKERFAQEEAVADLLPEDRDYALWKLGTMPDRKQAAEQSSAVFPENIAVSIAVPVYHPKMDQFRAFIASVKEQTYGGWELCLAASQEESEETLDFLRRLSAESRKFKVSIGEKNEGISGNTNRAILLASGNYIAFADQDDLIRKDALYEFARAVHLFGGDVFYSDEDKIDDETGVCYQPNFKPDFNPDLLCCNNYIGHMVMVKASLLKETGLLDPAMDGAQDHDLLLRLSERTDRFVHISKVLYSWRSHRDSTARNPQSKSWAYAAGASAVNSHYRRAHIPAEAENMENLPGWYRTEFALHRKPRISVIIPNRDHAASLRRCISSITAKTSWKDLEFVIVENGSTEPETEQFYRELEESGMNVKIVRWTGPFNYSAVNNFGAARATGEYLLLLNNDTEMISPDALESMAGYLLRDDVGAVGAKLYYPDDTVQHAGVLVGVSEGADHVFLGLKRGEPGYMGRAAVSQDMTAVTAACMMVRKSVYDIAGGFDPAFAVAYNDVDFCLKLRAQGYYIVFDAFSEWYHYESLSRGYETTREKQDRFESEKQLLRERWPEAMAGDPFYNRNLSLKHGYYKR